MTYRISRNNQIYGPYTDAEVRQYIGSGHILLTDLAQPAESSGSTEWALVGAVFASYIAQTFVTPDAGARPPGIPGAPYTTAPYAAPAGAPFPAPGPAAPAVLYPDPPDLPWWLALILGIVTAGFFFVVWDIVEASWLRRVERGSSALLLYIAVAVLYLVKLPGSWATVRYNIGGEPSVYTHAPGLALAALILIIVARFVFRRELLAHFNGPEPLNLHLNAFWTLLFGGLYFQYKFNRINRRKRDLQVSVPS